MYIISPPPNPYHPPPSNIPFMLTVGVLTRGKYGKRLLDTLAAHTKFYVTSADIPPTLPNLIDEPPLMVDIHGLAFNGSEPGDNPYPAIQGGRMLLSGSEWI